MPAVKFTAQSIKGFKPRNGEPTDYYDLHPDGRGLCLRVSLGRGDTKIFDRPINRVFYIRYAVTFAGKYKRYRMRLGPFSERKNGWTLEKARIRARKVRMDVDEGLDPVATAKEAKAAQTPFRKIFYKYLELYVKVKNEPNTYKGYKSAYERDVDPFIGDMEITSIKKAHIKEITDAIIDRGAEVQANRVFGMVKKAFNWAFEEDYIETASIFQMPRPTEEEARERDLKYKEIRGIWSAIENGTLNKKGALISMREPTKIALQLLLYLGQRVGEVSQAPRKEFDLEDCSWTIDKKRAKNRKSKRARNHYVPLPPKAMALVKRAFELAEKADKARAKPSQYLFPSPFTTKGREEDRPQTPTSLNKALNRVLKNTEIEDVRPHDFREVVTTGLASLEVPEEVYDAIINHLSGKVSATHYQRYMYNPQKRVALEKWETLLDNIVEGKINVQA